MAPAPTNRRPAQPKESPREPFKRAVAGAMTRRVKSKAIHRCKRRGWFVPVEYDPRKNQRNLERRGLSFELVNDFQWRTALVGRDDRQNYGEDRYWALGYIGQEFYNVVFTMRDKSIRVISLRKASGKERKAHDEKTRSELGR